MHQHWIQNNQIYYNVVFKHDESGKYAYRDKRGARVTLCMPFDGLFSSGEFWKWSKWTTSYAYQWKLVCLHFVRIKSKRSDNKDQMWRVALNFVYYVRVLFIYPSVHLNYGFESFKRARFTIFRIFQEITNGRTQCWLIDLSFLL